MRETCPHYFSIGLQVTLEEILILPVFIADRGISYAISLFLKLKKKRPAEATDSEIFIDECIFLDGYQFAKSQPKAVGCPTHSPSALCFTRPLPRENTVHSEKIHDSHFNPVEFQYNFGYYLLFGWAITGTYRHAYICV